MASDTTQAEHPRDPLDGTAVIPPVTDEMMDHAAHQAAALADGVAHHTIAHDGSAHETPGDPTVAALSPAEAAPSATEAAPSATEAAPSAAAEPVASAAERILDATPAAASDALEATTRTVDEAAADVEPLAEVARDASSAAADALGEYNAKVLDMMRANAASTTALFTALAQVKSLPEAFSLNADHLRRQMDTLTSQGRELTALAQRIALNALQPLKDLTGR